MILKKSAENKKREKNYQGGKELTSYCMFLEKSEKLRNEFDFWNVYGTLSCSCSGFTLTLQETRSIHDSMNIPKIEFIAYIYIFIIL